VTRVIEARVIDEKYQLNLDKRRVPIIPVLTSRDAVEINYNLQTVLPCPTDSLEKIFALTLNIRLARCDFVGPITYRDAHVIESKVYSVAGAHAAYFKDAPSSCNRLKVGLSNPRIPMFHQLCSCNIVILETRKRPLVYDGGISRVVKQAWCYPRLCGGGE
jgi:hypothetical protein